MTGQVLILILVMGLILLSGIGDSQGFIHASKIWNGNQLVWSEIGKSALGFGWGIVVYWIAIRFMNELGVISTEAQTLAWFAVTIVGVAIASGDFAKWNRVEQIVALLVFLGIGWLLYRGGG